MKKRLHKIAVFAVLCVCMLAVALSSRADFGSYSGDSDYGGSDYSSSDYSSSDYSGYSSYDGDDSDFSLGTTVFTLAIIIAIVLIGGLRKGKNSGSAPVRHTVSRPANLKPISEYTAIDEGFSEAEMKEKLSNLYVRMQQCWQNKNIEELRPFFTDSFYSQMEMQLKGIIDAKQTNHIERIAVLSVELEGFAQTETEDKIYAEIKTRIIDYTLDDKTGNVVSGSKTAEKFMTYEWELTRPTGKKTVRSEETKAVNCPNCGAPVEINKTARCPYCGSIITTENDEFVINTIKGVSQRTGK